MEQAEAAQKEVAARRLRPTRPRNWSTSRSPNSNQREENLKKELAELQQGRAELAAAVDETARNRYERLLKSKGDNVVVGIDHGVCGGCHMKLPAQIHRVSCKSQKEIVTCSTAAGFCITRATWSWRRRSEIF